MKLYQVDSFTRHAFKGNPAGVWVGERFPDKGVMQAIAAEMNISETAFIECSNNGCRIRYFTPAREVPLCGHATLASAHVLRELGIITEEELFVLHAPEADLPVFVTDSWVKMSFPRYAVSRIEQSACLEPILGASIKEAFISENGWVIARLFCEEALRNARPDFQAIQKKNITALIAATTVSDSMDFDYSVRVFCNPEYGIEEDPVTGAAQCILAPYWSGELRKTSFYSRQISKRGGEMMINLLPDTVEIMGQAITVFSIDVLA